MATPPSESWKREERAVEGEVVVEERVWWVRERVAE